MTNFAQMLDLVLYDDRLLTGITMRYLPLQPLDFTMCRFAWMVYQFSIMTNHFWLLNEGIYLLKVVHLNNLQPIEAWDCRALISPIAIGWLLPLMLITIQVFLFALQSNSKCWGE